jgi:hypothetical protein
MARPVSLSIVRSDDGHRVSEDPDTFLRELAGPTVFHLPGRDRSRARVVAGSLHGNEPSGLRAIHRVLAAAETPPVDFFFFVGAVEAARASPGFSLRMLPGRRDLNRCFRPPFEGQDGQVAEQALALLRQVRPEAVIDLHNNTGHNPAYAIGTRVDGARLGLCGLFANRYIASALRLGTFMEAFDDLSPSLTIECGRAGDPAADATAHAGLVRLLQLPRVSPTFFGAQAVSILTDPVRICLRAGVELAFDERPHPEVDLTLDAEIDRHNFEFLPAGTRLGWVRPGGGWPLQAADGEGRDQSRELFAVKEGTLLARRSFIPIMMTTDVAVARSDCLFYVVHQRW